VTRVGLAALGLTGAAALLWLLPRELDEPELRALLRGVARPATLLTLLAWTLFALAQLLRRAEWRDRLERLGRYARELHRGALEGGERVDAPIVVRAEHDGLPYRLVVRPEVRGVTHELWAWNSLLTFDLSRASLEARRRGVPHEPAGELELDQAVARLLDSHGQTRVTLGGGVLRAEAPLHDEALDPRALHSTLRALAVIARLVTRDMVSTPAAREGRAFAWTAAGGALRCPFCKDDLDPKALDVEACVACRTLHHGECLGDAGGCTVLGCSAAPTAKARAGRFASRDDRRGRGSSRFTAKDR
jgi:hypothetical protein